MTRVEKTPSMPFYGKDAYDDETFGLLSFGTQGLYVFLAWWQWQEGTIPADIEVILDKVPRRKVIEARKIWPSVEPLFPVLESDPTRRQNAAVERRRADVMRKRDRHRLGAEITNAERWGSASLVSSLSDGGSSSPRAAKASKGEREAEFEAVWNLYPRKRGKEKALTHFLAQVTSRADLAAITSAVKNYRREIDLLGTEERYVMHGQTFFNAHWREYADGSWKPPAAPRGDLPALAVVVRPDLHD